MLAECPGRGECPGLGWASAAIPDGNKDPLPTMLSPRVVGAGAPATSSAPTGLPGLPAEDVLGEQATVVEDAAFSLSRRNVIYLFLRRSGTTDTKLQRYKYAGV